MDHYHEALHPIPVDAEDEMERILRFLVGEISAIEGCEIVKNKATFWVPNVEIHCHCFGKI